MPNSQTPSQCCLWHSKVLSHLCVCEPVSSTPVMIYSADTWASTLKWFSGGGSRGEKNVWLKLIQLTWYHLISNDSNHCFGNRPCDCFCADWPHVHADMWRAISVHRGRETTPPGIVPRRGVSWNWKIQREWQRGTEHQHRQNKPG